MEQFNLTPNPAVLDLLGRIPFRGWQCVAELIDNSIDSIISHKTNLREDQKIITVTIPTKSKIAQNEPLVIEDSGIGMTESQLENSVRAGFSSKRSKSNLGLFGMGFNVATSRLANKVQVWTSTAEMDYEVGVCIDLKEMKRTGSFHRPKLIREKSTKRSGTRIEVFDYKPEAQNLLKPQDIYRELNRAYSERIFANHGIKILVDGKAIAPFRFCVWSENRSVKYKHEDIPAIIEIDEQLGEEIFCENCFSWLGEPVNTTLQLECPHCNTSDAIVKKEIYISGWVGIQRYSDTEHFGIDISRNGRILSRLDKSLFSWDDERVKEDPRFHPEYPRDTTYAGGRIVGQIEADFVIPKYTKDDFERDDKNWRKVIRFLRGEMPLQPDLAAHFGYTYPNRTPIGRLFNGYRKINTPGSKTLVFARENGSVDHVTPKNWAQEFYNGRADYQDDTKWWEAVTKADLRDSPAPFDPVNPVSKRSGRYTRPEEIHVKSADDDKYPGKKIHRKTWRIDLEKVLEERPFSLVLIDYYPELDIARPIIFEPHGQGIFHVYCFATLPMGRKT
jgi:hypothetical protein